MMEIGSGSGNVAMKDGRSLLQSQLQPASSSVTTTVFGHGTGLSCKFDSAQSIPLCTGSLFSGF